MLFYLSSLDSCNTYVNTYKILLFAVLKAQLMQTQPRLQGEFESIHRDLNIGFGKWEFDPVDLENPFQYSNGSVHLWMGGEDRVVPPTLQRYIAQRLGWINYHEVVGGGHMFAFADEMGDGILKALLN